MAPDVETASVEAPDNLGVVHPCTGKDQISRMQNLGGGQSWTKGPTTMLLQPVPEGYQQQMLMQEFDEAGFTGLYDWWDEVKEAVEQGVSSNRLARQKGRPPSSTWKAMTAAKDLYYRPPDAHVHFASPSTAEDFRAAFQGRRLRRFPAQEPLRVSPADSRLFDRGRRWVSELEGSWTDQGSSLYNAKRQMSVLASAVAFAVADQA